MKINVVTRYLETYAPLKIQESYDNCGLIVGDENSELTGVITTLDVTEDVIDEAISFGCNLIVAHHPIIFFGLKKLNPKTYVERTVLKAIKNNVAIYAMHTNLDKVYNGVNQKILSKIGVEPGKSFKNELLNFNTPGSPFGIVGSGMIGTLKTPEFALEFLERVKKEFKCDVIKHTCRIDKEIKTIAVCGGAGFSLLKDAMSAGVDLFLTSDITYHQFFDADNKIILADMGHYESEQFTKELLKEIIEKIFEYDYAKDIKLKIEVSHVQTNPVNYL